MTNFAASAMSFAGTMESARATANNYKYEQQVAENNAKTIDQQGDAAVAAQGRAFSRSLGTMTASYGGTGVDTTMGSPTNVLTDAIRQGTLDQLTTKYNYNVAAGSQLEQAKLDKLGARNATTSGWFNAIANGLSSFTSGQVNAGGYGGGVTPSGGSSYGGNSLTPGFNYTGNGSMSTSWPGSGSTNDFNGTTGSGTYVGSGSSAATWAGFGGGWG